MITVAQPEPVLARRVKLPDAATAWRATLGRVQEMMPPTSFKEHLAPCVGHEWNGDELTVAVASSFSVGWLEIPLHKAMAEESLAASVGTTCSILYRALPGITGDPKRFAPDSASAGDSVVAEADIPFCPVHPQDYLRHESTAPSFVRVMQASGDRVFLCRGDSGGCSWRYSVQVGEYSLAAGPQPESIGADFGLYMAERQRLGLNTHRRRQPQERRGYARR